jgi:hypothetical protein
MNANPSAIIRMVTSLIPIPTAENNCSSPFGGLIMKDTPIELVAVTSVPRLLLAFSTKVRLVRSRSCAR